MTRDYTVGVAVAAMEMSAGTLNVINRIKASTAGVQEH
jgi:hypothetical protein